MLLELKRYQRSALDALGRFFDLARGAPETAGLDAAFRQTLREQDLADAHSQAQQQADALAEAYEAAVATYEALLQQSGGA